MLQRTNIKLLLFTIMVSAFVSIVVGLLIALFFIFTPCRKCGKLQGFKIFGFIIAALPIGFCLHCGESYLFDENQLKIDSQHIRM